MATISSFPIRTAVPANATLFIAEPTSPGASTFTFARLAPGAVIIPSSTPASGITTADVQAFLLQLPSTQPTASGQLWWNNGFLVRT